MGKCKDVTRLLSDALDRSLTAGEWLATRVHLPMCSGCRAHADVKREPHLLSFARHTRRGRRMAG